MSHLSFKCMNCGDTKGEELTLDPYCADCIAAVDAVRAQADKSGWGKSLYDMAKFEALKARKPALGMAGKLDPRVVTDRFDTSEMVRRLR